MCGPSRLPERVLSSLHTLPDPMPGEEGRYKQFTELYGTETNKSHHPSLPTESKKELEEALADFMFTCGASLQELQLAGKLAELCERPICVYCACSVPEGSATAEHYPHCFGCSRKPNILK